MRELTDQEMHVLILAAQGKGNKQTAKEMGISIHTVKDYRARVLAFFRAGNITQAVALAVALKYINLTAEAA